MWVVLGGSVLLGLVLGFLLTKCKRVGAAAAGAWGGFLLGIELNLLWSGESLAVNIACAATAVILAVVFFHHVVILSTSLSGSYLFVRGISICVAGTIQSEGVGSLTQWITKWQNSQITMWFYICLASIFLLWCLTALFQYR